MSSKQLILVDGSSFLFRAYHAMPALVTSSGQATGAIYGITNMLRKLLDECNPEYVAVVFDAKGPTFRHKMYPQYKANRPPIPDDLRDQIDLVNQIVIAMGVVVISVKSVEADDVIGTLSVRALEHDMDCLIISSDKDLAQLVNERVEMFDPTKGQRLDIKGVNKKFGVQPQQIIDYLALMGDSSDNIPGIANVGPKTAARWLDEYKTIDNIITHAAKIKGKVGENLRNNLDQLALSRQLATIKCDVELCYQPVQLRFTNEDHEALKILYQKLEFYRWLDELDQSEENKVEAPDTHYETILEFIDLKRWIKKLSAAELFAFDTETTSMDPQRAQLVGMSFCISPHEAAYLPLAHDYIGVPQQIDLNIALATIKPLLENKTIKKVGQNLKYDIEVLARVGIHLGGIAHDTMLQSYLLDARNARHDLDTLALKHLSHQTIKFSTLAGSGRKQLTFNQIPLEQAAPYAAEDADITLQLHHALYPQLEQRQKQKILYHELEIPLIQVLVTIETNGVLIDTNMLVEQSKEITHLLVQLEQQAHQVAGETFNIASPKQVQEILFEKLKLPVLRKTPKGQPSTAENVLDELAGEFELPRLILEHRGLAKLKNTYTDKLPKLINPYSGRIHTSYQQAVAATGRLSSSNPNLQNIPIRSAQGGRIREAFIPAPGHVLLSADYSQIELRIMAHLSQDSNLLESFTKGLDVHRHTAAEVFDCAVQDITAEQRYHAKAINFGLIYGMSAFGLARQLRIKQHDAKAYIDRYFERYPGVKKYMDTTREQAKHNGYVETLLGRRLYLPEINSKNPQRRQYAERTAINAPMQGTAADLIKRAMLVVDQWICENCPQVKIILQVHDELVFELPKNDLEYVAEQVCTLMSGVAKLSIPLTVDTGHGINWKQAH